MSNVSEAYAPANKVLICVSLNGIFTVEDDFLTTEIKNEVKQWFGPAVDDWNLLAFYKIKYALPNQFQVKNEPSIQDLQINENTFICGDYLLNGSIDAAMKTGRKVAELIAHQK